jgi:hypothetical protein
MSQATWSMFCKTEPWNGRRNWLGSGTITRGLMPQVQYRKFWKRVDGKCFPTRRTVLTWAHQTLTCSHNWRNHSVGNASEALRRRLMRWPEKSDASKRRRPDRNTKLAQTLDRCYKAQWWLHWRPVNVFCKTNSFLKRKRTVCRTFEMTHVCICWFDSVVSGLDCVT